MKPALFLLTLLAWPLLAQAADAQRWADYWADTYGMPRYIAGPGRIMRRGLNYDSEPVHRYVERVAYLYRRNRRETLQFTTGELP